MRNTNVLKWMCIVILLVVGGCSDDSSEDNSGANAGSNTSTDASGDVGTDEGEYFGGVGGDTLDANDTGDDVQDAGDIDDVTPDSGLDYADRDHDFR